jgi:hypothetical protein
MEDVEYSVDRILIEETKAANLRPEIPGIEPAEEGYRRRGEHADLGALVTQMRDFEDLRQLLEARICACAELSFGRIECVAGLAGEGRLSKARPNWAPTHRLGDAATRRTLRQPDGRA